MLGGEAEESVEEEWDWFNSWDFLLKNFWRIRFRSPGFFFRDCSSSKLGLELELELELDTALELFALWLAIKFIRMSMFMLM